MSNMDTTMCAIRIISPASANDLAERAEAGDKDVCVWANAIGEGLKQVEAGKPWECLGCDAVFENPELGVFVVAMPTKEYDHGRKNDGALTGAICSHCVHSGKDLKQITVQSLRAAEAAVLNEIN